jgi:hypothetical protein
VTGRRPARLDYRIDPAAGLALARVSGEVTGHDVARFVRRLQSDPDWRPTFDAIWDERGITLLDVTPDGLDEMVDAQAEGQVGADVVVTEREDRELVQRLYALRVRARGRPATVCDTLDGALAAVGLGALPERLRW